MLKGRNNASHKSVIGQRSWAPDLERWSDCQSGSAWQRYRTNHNQIHRDNHTSAPVCKNCNFAVTSTALGKPQDRKMFLDTLRNTKQGIGNYVWKAGLMSVIPTFGIAALVRVAIGPDGGPDFSGPVASVVFGHVVVGPFLETLLMWPIILLLQRLMRSDLAICFTTAVLCGVFHSLKAPLWGIFLVWPFFVFTNCFLAWKQESIRLAILVTALTHSLHNLPSALITIAKTL